MTFFLLYIYILYICVCVYLYQAEDSQIEFSICINNSATLGKTKSFQLYLYKLPSGCSDILVTT